MEEKQKMELEALNVQAEEKSSFDFAAIYTTLVLNWKWFVLSLIICLGAAAIYLALIKATYLSRHLPRLLIKGQRPVGRGNSSMLNVATLGLFSNSNGYRQRGWRFLPRTRWPSRLCARPDALPPNTKSMVADKVKDTSLLYGKPAHQRRPGPGSS
jgi:hypothetical protein